MATEEDFERLNIILTARDREFARALDRNTKRVERFTRQTQDGLGRTGRAFRDTERAADGMGRGLGRVINMSGSGRFVLQNTAAQLGDIAVQLESGTAASRVMAQQLPQIFGGFGALGGALGVVAPLLGTVAAVGIPLGAMMLTLGGDSAAAADDVLTFTEALEAAHSEMENAAQAVAQASGAEDLSAIYEGVTAKVMALADALADIELRAAAQSTGTAIRSLLEGAGLDTAILSQAANLREATQVMREYTAENLRIQELFKAGTAEADAAILEEFGSKGAAFDRTDYLVKTIGELRDALPDVAEFARALGATEEQARGLVAALAEAAQADGPEAMRAAYAAAADVISEIREGLQAAGVDVRVGLAAELTQTEALLRENVARLDDGAGAAAGLADAAGGVAPQIAAANAEAVALVANLGAAMAALGEVVRGVQAAQRKALQEVRIRQETVGQPVARAERLARAEYQEDSGAAAYAMIRSGNSGRLEELAETADDIADGAGRVAAAEEALAEAEARFRDTARKTARAGRAGGGGASGGGKGRGSRGGGRAARPAAEIRDFDRALDAFAGEDIAAEGYRAALARLRAEYDAGRISAAEFRAGIDDVEGAARLYGRTLDGLADTFGDGNGHAEGYRAALERLRAEFAAGRISAEVFEAGVEDIAERFEANARAAETFRSSAAQTFASIVTGSQSASEALANLASQWADTFANAAFSGLFKDAGIFDALGALASFDGGGRTPDRPRSGGIDGKGGFLAVLHPRETVIDHTRGGVEPAPPAGRPGPSAGGAAAPFGAPAAATRPAPSGRVAPDLSGLPSFDGGGDTPEGARAGGVDGKGGFLAVLHPRESVIDHTRGGGAAAGGSVSVTFAPRIDARGAEPEAIAELRGDMRRMKAEFEGRVVRTVRDAKTRRIL